MKKKIGFSAVLALLLAFIPVMGFAASAFTSMPSKGSASLVVADISQYNGTLNFSSLKKGVNAVYMRASIRNKYGNIVADTQFSYNATQAQKQGLSHGYYHYFRPSKTAKRNTEQADYFYNTIKNYAYDCLPAIDVEDFTDTNGDKLSKAQVSLAVRQFCERFTELSGRNIMIYTYNSFIDDYLDKSLSGYPLWLANTTAKGPWVTDVWSKWDMHQYTFEGSISGVSGAIDLSKATKNIYLSSITGITHINGPSGTLGKGDATVDGFAISYYGVDHVLVYADGDLIGTINSTEFTADSAVNSKYAGKGYDLSENPAFSMQIPYQYLTGGHHSLMVAAVDKKGNTVNSVTKSYSVDIEPIRVTADNPASTNYGDITLSGWALSPYGMDKIDAYIDGTLVKTFNSDEFTERNDVANAYASYDYEDKVKCGFYTKIAKDKISAGSHKLVYVATDKKGIVTKAEKTFSNVYAENRVTLEKPSGSYTDAVDIKGFALSYYGVDHVNLYVDGTKVEEIPATEFTARADIEIAYKKYNYSDPLYCQFTYSIAADALKPGSHTVKAELVDKNEDTRTTQNSFTIVVPDNRTHLDSPSDTTYGGEIKVSGWSVSHYDLAKADLYIDGKIYKTYGADNFFTRSDVTDHFDGEGYKAADSGYSFQIPSDYLNEGRHTVKVVVTDVEGRTSSSSQSFTFKVAANRIALDAPRGDVGGEIHVSGWALSHYGVRCVDVWVDGRLYMGGVNGANFTSRGDVANVYKNSGYMNIAKSGYSLTIPKNKLSAGKHTIAVALIDNKNRVKWSSSNTINVIVPQDRIGFESPSGVKYSDFAVSGWALSRYGVANVDIYIDGAKVGTVAESELYNRSDVAKSYSSYGYENISKAGFNYKISKGTLSKGNHTAQVAVINKNGNVKWSAKKSFTISVPDNRMNIEAPSGTRTGDVSVSGWAISPYGVSKADIYLDGSKIGSVNSADFTTRNDVATAYASKGYLEPLNSGFSFAVPREKLTSGSHSVKILLVDKSGRSTWSGTKNFTMNIADNRVNLEGPGSAVNKDFDVSGWTLSYYGVSRVDIYIDSNKIGSVSASELKQRNDVAAAYKSYGYKNISTAGFAYRVTKSSLAVGKHTAKAVSVDSLGHTKSTSERTFVVS